jgi:ribosome maturation factor RimP
LTDDLESLIDKIVSQLGYELVDLEIINHGQLLRVFIDKPNSVNIDDCVEVSNQLNHVLTVEEEVNYDRLEVSSPGVYRVIKKLEDFDRFKGEWAKIKTRFLIHEKKNFRGVLIGTKGNLIIIDVDNFLLEINFDNIEKARLDPNL